MGKNSLKKCLYYRIYQENFNFVLAKFMSSCGLLVSVYHLGSTKPGSYPAISCENFKKSLT